MQGQPLEIGRIYFNLAFEDDDMRLPVIYSCEYLGITGGNVGVHTFRLLGTGDSLELNDGQLDLIVGLDELTTLLRKWAQQNPNISAQ